MPSPVYLARHAPKEDGDFFPTPPWATRALLHTLKEDFGYSFGRATVLEPMAGAGHMAKTIDEFGALTSAYDNRRWQGDRYTGNYNIGKRDFLKELPLPGKWAWAITNPAYAEAAETVEKMHGMVTHGCAVLVRVQFLETERRQQLFARIGEPTQLMFFSNRISFVKNRVVRDASRYFFHIWAVWDKQDPKPRPPLWMPFDAQQLYEKDSDYEE